MHSDLSLAILAGVGSMLGWGVADFYAKKTIDTIGDVTTLFWGQLIGIVPLFILFFFHPVFPHLSGISSLALIILGIWSGLSYIPTYVAFGKGKVSLLSPIFASYAVIVSLLSALFLHEIIPVSRLVAFLIVFIGILFINGDPRAILTTFSKKTKHEVKGLREILLAVGLYSVWLIALDQMISGKDWVPYLLVIRVVSTLSLLMYTLFTKRKLFFSDKSLWKYLLCIGVFDVAAFSFVSYGFSHTQYVSIVAMLSGAFSLPTIILARIFLKEKSTYIQTVGSLIVIAGLILLAVH